MPRLNGGSRPHAHATQAAALCNQEPPRSAVKRRFRYQRLRVKANAPLTLVLLHLEQGQHGSVLRRGAFTRLQVERVAMVIADDRFAVDHALVERSRLV